MKLKKLAAALAQTFGVPTNRQAWLGPRFEPSNISSSATISTVQTAVRDAENGDPTSLFRFYRDSLLGDEHVQGELAKRKLAVLNETMQVLPREEGNADDLAAAALCAQAIEDCENWTAGLSALLGASQWPVAMVENIYQPAQGRPVRFESDDGVEGSVAMQYTLRRLEPVNPMLFCFRHAYLVGGVGLGTATPIQQAGLMKEMQSQGRLAPGTVGTSPWYSIDLNDWEPFLRLWPIDEAGRIIYDASRASKLDPSRHIVHRGHTLADQRDNWGGPMRAIMGWWLLRGLGRDWFARFMERYGSPFPIGKTNTQDPQAIAFLQTAFSTAVKIGGLVIGQDDQVELKEAMVQGGADGHDTWHRVCNDAISFHITGYKSSQRPAGLNSGESNQSENIRDDVRRFDQRTLAETLVKQVFKNLLGFNGQSGAVRVVWGGLSASDAASLAQMIKTMADAGLEPAEESLATIDDRTGLQWQRRSATGAAPAPSAPEAGAPAADEETQTLSVRDAVGRLIYFSAGGGRPRAGSYPLDPIVARRLEALAEAYRGSMAPFRQAIIASADRADCLRRLQGLYRDWSPARLEAELETALQLCAAAGVAAAGS